MGQFCRYPSSVSHAVQTVPPWFELQLFMNQLVVAVRLEANIIGRQLWIGSFFARPCCKRGLVCEARTFCHSSPNVSMSISCRLSSREFTGRRCATLMAIISPSNRQKKILEKAINKRARKYPHESISLQTNAALGVLVGTAGH